MIFILMVKSLNPPRPARPSAGANRRAGTSLCRTLEGGRTATERGLGFRIGAVGLRDAGGGQVVVGPDGGEACLVFHVIESIYLN